MKLIFKMEERNHVNSDPLSYQIAILRYFYSWGFIRDVVFNNKLDTYILLMLQSEDLRYAEKSCRLLKNYKWNEWYFLYNPKFKVTDFQTDNFERFLEFELMDRDMIAFFSNEKILKDLQEEKTHPIVFIRREL